VDDSRVIMHPTLAQISRYVMYIPFPASEYATTPLYATTMPRMAPAEECEELRLGKCNVTVPCQIDAHGRALESLGSRPELS